MSRVRSALIPLVLALVFAAPASAAMPRDLTYGVGGVTGQIFSGNPFATVQASNVQADGKLVIAGRAYGVPASSSQRLCIARLNTDGTLDMNFGPSDDGKICLYDGFSPSASSDAAVSQIAFDSQGRILLAATRGVFSGSFHPRATAIRLVTWGSFDISFGGTGFVDVDVNDSKGLGISVDSQDRVTIGSASGFPFFASSPKLTRLTAAGIPDSDFGTGGVASLNTAAEGFPLVPVNLVNQPSDGLAVVGDQQKTTVTTGGSSTFTGALAISRVSSNGTPAPALTLHPASGAQYPRATAAAATRSPDGAIVFSGSAYGLKDQTNPSNGTEYDTTVAGTGTFVGRIAPAGSTATVVIVPDSGGPAQNISVAGKVAATDSRIVALASPVATPKLVAYTSSLAPDTSFADTGSMAFPGFGTPGSDKSAALAFDAGGNLLIAGGRSISGSSTNFDFAAIRFGTASGSSGGGGGTGGGGAGAGPPPVPLPPAFVPASKTLKAKGGKTSIQVTCKGSTSCAGSAQLYAAAKKGKKVIKTKYASCKLAATNPGVSAKCTLKLSSAAKKALKAKSKLKLKLDVKTGTTTVTYAVSLKR